MGKAPEADNIESDRGEQLDTLARIQLADHVEAYQGKDGNAREWKVSGTAQREVLRAIDDHQHSRHRREPLTFEDAEDRFRNSRPGLLTRTGLSSATIRRALIGLQSKGVLTCETYRDAGIGGQHRTYAILWNKLAELVTTTQGTRHHDGGYPSPQREGTRHHDGSTSYSALDSATCAPGPAKVPIPSELDSDEFRDAWSRWLAYRQRDRRKPVSATAARRQLAKLAVVGVVAAIAAIDKSIANDWQGLFPDASRQDDPYAGLRAFVSQEGGAQ